MLPFPSLEQDPEKKLEELRRLPPLFVQEFVARETKDSGMKNGYHSGTRSGGPRPWAGGTGTSQRRLTHSDASTQTENPALEDKGIQATVADDTSDDEQAAIDGDQVDSVTPKMSALGLSTRYQADTFRYKSGDVDPKANDEVLRKRRITRGHSVDSAIGSGTDESGSLRAESIES